MCVRDDSSSGPQMMEDHEFPENREPTHTRPRGRPAEMLSPRRHATLSHTSSLRTLGGKRCVVSGQHTPDVPGKPRVIARARFGFAQRVTLGTSDTFTPRFPWPTTLTNHSGVSDIGRGQKRCCFTDRIRPESHLLVSSAGLDTSPLVCGCGV